MGLAAEVARYLQELEALGIPPLEKLPVETARQLMLGSTVPLETGQQVKQMTDRQVPGPAGPIRIRLYDPGTTDPSPAVVFFHGGGWVLGSIETHDCLCRCLACETGLKIVSVDYRLAPEHRYPAAVEDAWAAVNFLYNEGRHWGIDGKRLIVAGDSAGGNLAAVMALKARDEGAIRLSGQVLLYPVLDHDFDTDSYRAFQEGYYLTRSAMIWFWDQYVPWIEKRNEPYAAPLRCADLQGLAPAVIVTAECDPLRDEAAAYAERLQQAGNSVLYRCYEGMIHGFVRRLRFWTAGQEALGLIARQIRRWVEGDLDRD
ncbi:MAG: putative lipase/esterase [Pirellulaceae bacterium]|nr:MAG: putative lipase/esterase [Pirellulaceae bacterium]